MAMSMEEMFYGENEPVYFARYGRQRVESEPYARHEARTEFRRMELITFDLMVPMCCTECEDQVRDALFALRSVQDVLCDRRNQRVIVTGCLDPAQALKQVRRVKNGATFWSDSSSYSAHRYEISSYQKSHEDNRNRRSYLQSEQRSYPGQYNRSSSDRYNRSLCPAYRDTTKTYFVSLNPTIATVEEREW